MTKPTCPIADCTNPRYGRGYCGKHRARFIKYGDPMKTSRIVGDNMTRFMSKVAVMPSGCHEWQAGKFGSGYGNFTVDGGGKVATRWIWEQINGPIEDGLQVRHKCDNPPCVNLDHLELGTNADNSRDMVERGRSLVGERTHTAKLTAEDVTEIRTLMAAGNQTKTSIARAYGTTRQNVTHIVNAASWKHVP
jgi:hypothetical protein